MPLNKNAKIGIAAGGALSLGAIMYFATRAEAAPPPGGYCCPYCDQCFDSYEQLVDHAETEHPGERTPLPIEWD